MKSAVKAGHKILLSEGNEPRRRRGREFVIPHIPVSGPGVPGSPGYRMYRRQGLGRWVGNPELALRPDSTGE